MTSGDKWHREAERHLVRDGIALGLTLAAVWSSLLVIGCTVSGAHKVPETVRIEVAADLPAVDPDEAARYEQLVQLAETRAGAAETAQEVPFEEEWDGYAESDWTWAQEPIWEPEYEVPSDGLTAFTGVNYHEGRTETYYSSNVLYHYRTPEWTLDEEGFYRDAEGRYVVAASDMEQGTVFEGSKGTCIVLDCGCADGVTDYYVNWN